jgi:hypothetical protein
VVLGLSDDHLFLFAAAEPNPTNATHSSPSIATWRTTRP